MSTFYIKNNQIDDEIIKVVGDDVKHIKKVLRYNVDDYIELCDENGVIYEAQICEYTDKDEILCKINGISEKKAEVPYTLVLYQGLPKSDKLETVIQKCTELGVTSFIPVQMARSVVKINEEKGSKKTDRWNKIAAEASKQCGRQKIPMVNNVINFENIIENISKYDIVLVPYESEENISIKQILKGLKSNIASIAIVIGPEGGFSEEEINLLKENGAQICTLGQRILRTETAAIATVSMVNYELEL
ncbi:MAG: 16S rRNA (uracil(1498)-N(3))-methyltransferase [Clostridia bacterium]|nr:16S rRNA (uracil(1498)-N(3))-methyltransferase [Clostridia bacterium]